VTASIVIRNQQRRQRVDTRLLRRLTHRLVRDYLRREAFDLAVYLVDARKMTVINETYLQHEGSTDVITFDYTEPDRRTLAGELFVCLDEALIQAARFHTTWPSELTRYVVHGILHLCGHDDHDPAARRVMKRHESRLLRRLDEEFGLQHLDLSTKDRQLHPGRSSNPLR